MLVGYLAGEGIEAVHNVDNLLLRESMDVIGAPFTGLMHRHGGQPAHVLSTPMWQVKSWCSACCAWAGGGHVRREFQQTPRLVHTASRPPKQLNYLLSICPLDVFTLVILLIPRQTAEVVHGTSWLLPSPSMHPHDTVQN